ncbi:hypothetical protein [Croceicoccus mobilis]|uniref:Uncharacterized protein n=1 Tax=Croceicoccus mobilis TaxID=1703339 RepID=A0A917DWV7_9SPHN|nr:hypothetical protein [Croceicoccus mobilis]GGD74119.1 hypothetical protein GCM10010990_24700 [Croceicoccus mobilis]
MIYGEKATYACKNPSCGKNFVARTAERKQGKASFCSRSCASIYNKQFGGTAREIDTTGRPCPCCAPGARTERMFHTCPRCNGRRTVHRIAA